MRLDERYDDVPVVVLTGVTELDPAEDEIIQRLEKIITVAAA